MFNLLSFSSLYGVLPKQGESRWVSFFIANPKNPQAMFSVTPDLYTGLSSALQDVLETNARCLASGRSTGSYEGVNGAMAPQLSPDVISRKYPEFAPALYNLIRETEEKIKKLS